MKRTFLFNFITTTLLMGTASLSMAQSAPINSLDCTEEEVLSYASKDKYEEPIGISVMPSVAEYKPAYTMQKMKEEKDLDAAEKGCPTIIPDDAWDKLVEGYEGLVNGLKQAAKAIRDLPTDFSADTFTSMIQDQINSAIESMREAANKSVCTRIEELNLDSYAGDVMWNVIDERFGVTEDAYKDGTKTVVQAIINDQNSRSDSEMVKMLDQAGVDGKEIVNFFDDAGIDSEGIINEGNDIINDNVNDDIGDIGDEYFGDSDNPFDDTIDDITGDIEDGVQEGTNIN
jgi:predicted transcriptional regulator